MRNWWRWSTRRDKRGHSARRRGYKPPAIVVATAVAARPCYIVTADRDLYDDANLVATLRALEVYAIQAGEFLAALSVQFKT